MIKSTKCDLCGNSGLHACTGITLSNKDLPRNIKVIDNFINNAGKSTEKPVIEYNAFTGEQGKTKHELDVTLADVVWIVSAACLFGAFTLAKITGLI